MSNVVDNCSSNKEGIIEKQLVVNFHYNNCTLKEVHNKFVKKVKHKTFV